jgi:hypothetical protein
LAFEATRSIIAAKAPIIAAAMKIHSPKPGDADGPKPGDSSALRVAAELISRLISERNQSAPPTAAAKLMRVNADKTTDRRDRIRMRKAKTSATIAPRAISRDSGSCIHRKLVGVLSTQETEADPTKL